MSEENAVQHEKWHVNEIQRAKYEISLRDMGDPCTHITTTYMQMREGKDRTGNYESKVTTQHMYSTVYTTFNHTIVSRTAGILRTEKWTKFIVYVFNQLRAHYVVSLIWRGIITTKITMYQRPRFSNICTFSTLTVEWNFIGGAVRKLLVSLLLLSWPMSTLSCLSSLHCPTHAEIDLSWRAHCASGTWSDSNSHYLFTIPFTWLKISHLRT